MIALTILSAAAVLTLSLTASWYNVQNLREAVREAPSLKPITDFQPYADAFSPQPMEGLGGSIVQSVYRASGWMGYDDLGRSLLFRTMFGWLISMAIACAAAGVSVVIGTAWGATAALFGGRVDMVMMRVVDVLYGLPYVLFIILLKVVLERPLGDWLGGQARLANVIIVFVAIGSVGWLTMARVIRGQVLSLRNQVFIEAALAAGAGRTRILWRHLLPNLVGPIVVYATLVMPQAILQESFLSFLGIGVASPVPSLGRLAADGVQGVNTVVGFWWLLAFPCGILLVTLLAFNFIGDGLRDALDPKTRKAML